MAILKAELDIQLRKIEEQAVTLKNKAIKAPNMVGLTLLTTIRLTINSLT